MPKFHTAQDAYEWAIGTYEAWMFGRAFDPNPDLFRGGGFSDALDAITIMGLVKKHDIVRAGVSLFKQWYLPNPMEIVYWSDAARDKVQAAAHEFEEDLKARGFLHT